MTAQRDGQGAVSSVPDDNDPIQAALRAADEIAAALQAHLTQEHGASVDDRGTAASPSLDLLRHARTRIALGLQEVKRNNRRSRLQPRTDQTLMAGDT